MRDIATSLSAQELQDLEDLLASPGWRLIEIMVDREWGATGFGQKIAQTVGQMAGNPKDLEQLQLAAQHLAQATVTQTEVQRIMKWPRETLAEAKRAALGRVASMNRGGV
jgi:hypothetical protein